MISDNLKNYIFFQYLISTLIFIPFEIAIQINNKCLNCDNNNLIHLVADIFVFVTLISCLLTIKYLSSSYEHHGIAKNFLIFIFGMNFILKGVGFMIKFDCNYKSCIVNVYYVIYYLYVVCNSILILFLFIFLIIKHFYDKRRPLINGDKFYVNL